MRCDRGRDVDWSTVVAVETHQLDLPGVTLLRPAAPQLCRTSPMAARARLLWVKSIKSSSRSSKSRDTSSAMKLASTDSSGAGKNVLRGQSGGQQVEVDALGRRVRVLHEVSRRARLHGSSDSWIANLQLNRLRSAQRQTGAPSLRCDVHNGAILALASTPAFDPNAFARGIKSEEWRASIKDQLAPAQQSRDSRSISAGLDFQDHHGHRLASKKASFSRKLPFTIPAFILSAIAASAIGNKAVTASVEFTQSDRRVLRHLFLSARSEARRRPHRQVGARFWSWEKKPAVVLDDERAARFPIREWKKETISSTLVSGRNGFRGHRPGLCHGDAAAARQYDGRRGQRRQRFIVRALVSKVESVDGATVRNMDRS